jgi:hypothetical protein
MGWTNLSFAYGSILTSAKMTQLYDNITATANGDAGAPDIKQASFPLMVAGTIYMNPIFSIPSTGPISIFAVNTVVGAIVEKYNCRILQAGTYRASFVLVTTNGAAPANGRIYKNGSAVGSLQVSSDTGGTTFTQDLTFAAGDTSQLFFSIPSGAAEAYAWDFKFGINQSSAYAISPIIPLILGDR